MSRLDDLRMMREAVFEELKKPAQERPGQIYRTPGLKESPVISTRPLRNKPVASTPLVVAYPPVDWSQCPHCARRRAAKTKAMAKWRSKG